MLLPFHAEHVGSLLRPAELVESHKDSTANPGHAGIPEERKEYDELERKCIVDVVQQQLNRRITPITDGEYGRTLFYDGLFEKTSGFSEQHVPWSAIRTNFPTTSAFLKRGYKSRALAVATGKIAYSKGLYLNEWLFLRSVVPKEKWNQCKITMPAPTWMHMQLKSGSAHTSTSPYSSDAEYFADLTEVYRREFQTLYDAGLRNIQIDDPQMTYFCDEEFIRGCQVDGQDPKQLLDLYIDVYNACLKDKPSSLHVGIHLCRGNAAQGQYFSSGSYENIAKKLFNDIACDTFYLEYDTVRAGGFEPLRLLPSDKNVVLGVVTTKSAEIEDLQVLKKRIEEAVITIAEGQGRDREEVMKNVGVSPQCGFSSASSGWGVGMDREKMWEKLKLVQNLAIEMWGNEA